MPPSRGGGRRRPATWYRADLHLHTPASQDYAEEGVTYLDILQRAEQRGLDIIALTDHNTVFGYACLRKEIDDLAFLERAGRIQPEEIEVHGEPAV